MKSNLEEFILQWNTNSLVSHWGEFREYMTNKKPLIAAIQETLFLDTDSQNYTFTLSGYSLYCNNVNTKPRRGGSALYVSNNLLHNRIIYDSPLNYVAANIKIAQRDVNVISIYLSPNLNITEQQLDHLFGQISPPCLIVGDFNAQHTAWGCHSNNTRGNTLHTLLDKHNLVYLNDMTPTFHCTRQGRTSFSVLDLALASPQIAPILTPHVQVDKYFSDHYPIHLTIGIPSGQFNNFIPKWNFNKADWDSFQEYIDDNYSRESEPDINNFLNVVLQAAHNFIPHTTERPGLNHSPWWTPQCKQAVAKRRRALRAFQRCICGKHESEARKAREEAKTIIDQAKKEGWKKFSNNFNRFTPLSKIWNLIRCFKIKRKPDFKIPHLIINDTHHSTPLDVATQFAAHYARVSAHNNYPQQLHDTLNTTLTTCHFQSDNTEHYNHLFTLYELQLAISKCGNTSIGPDQMAYPFFKNLSESGLINFLTALNQLWKEGTFPLSWSSSTLIPILKNNKPPSDPASYRPISLSSCASKIFERMVNSRIRVYLESNQKLTLYQNGFRPGRSTADNLIHIIDSAQRGFQQKQVTVALFLDLKAAFDKVHHSSLLIKLHEIGVRGRLATFIKNFLNNRTFSVRCGKDFSERTAQENGVPQGSPLSPTLFLILINDVFSDMSSISPQIKYSLYADDLAVWFSHACVDTANLYIQQALNSIQRWCCRWGVQISPAKSASLVFSQRPRHNTPHIPLNLNGENIPQVNNFKYLGLTLDRRLTFNAHIADLKQRCSRRINILKCIAGREWGADRRTLLHLYTTLIRPILDFNAFLFGNISQTQSNKLESIQNSALRVAIGALRTTPIKNLNIETNIPPLVRRREYQLLRYLARSAARPETNSFSIMSQPVPDELTDRQFKFPTINIRIKKLLNEYKVPFPHIMRCPPLQAFWMNTPIETTLLFSDPKATLIPEDIINMFNQFKSEHQDSSFVYTDGSRADNRTGSAFLVDGYHQSSRLPDFFSVFSAELQAIASALQYIDGSNLNHSKVVICTDSKSAVCALAAQHNSAHPIIDQIRKLINNSNKDIEILWIPGHCGIPGNEKVDKCAKEILRDQPQNDIPCPASDYLNHLHSSFRATLQLVWDLNPHYHLHQIKPRMGHWPSSNRNTKLQEIILARLRVGHTSLTHYHIFEHSPPPICHRCGCRYTIDHFLLRCPVYDSARHPLIRYTATNRLPLTLSVLLGDSYPDLLDLLFVFLHETKLELSI